MILAIDVSARKGLISLELPDGRLLTRVSEQPREHNSFLERSLAELREETGRPWHELSRVGVCIGPGSFTGLRVGLASAKGLVFGSGIPVAPLSSLALPAAARPDAAEASCLVSRVARGREFWLARFEPGASSPEWEKLVDADALLAAARELAGEASGACCVGDWPEESAAEAPLPLLPEPAPQAQAEAMARLAREAVELLAGPDLDRLLPRYLMEPSVTPPRDRSAG